MKKQKIKYRKIRGINRRKRAIEKWGSRNKVLDIEKLKQIHRDYVKFWVSPWTDFSLINSVYPEPTVELKSLLIANLMSIHDSWDEALKQLEQPYDLQTWLFEGAVSRSQVTCTINEPMDFTNVFEPVEEQPSEGIKSSNHYNDDTAEVLDRYDWTLHKYIQAHDLADPFDVEYIESVDSQQLLRIQTIGQKEYQMIEIDKVWLLLEQK